MQLEDYLNFEDNYIRLKGTRIGIDIILWQYLDEKLTLEQIQELYPHLSLEQIYASITYYWHNKEQMDAYLKELDDDYHAKYEAQMQTLPPRLIELLRKMEAGERLPPGVNLADELR